LDHRRFPGAVGDQQVVLLLTGRKGFQAVQLGGGVDAHAGVGGIRGDLGRHGGVGELLPVIAVDRPGVQVFFTAEVVRQDPGAGALRRLT